MRARKFEPGKPLISILMAVYEPRIDWLREQLNSLEAQSYPNLKLYVREDCSSGVAFEDICRCIEECIHSIPYEINRNGKNVGSNLTFERLTEEAEGDYFAYCDQDDVWLPEKLEMLHSAIKIEAAQLVCSDMDIIDERGSKIADSITKVRRHHVFRSGDNLAAQLLISNFVTGCTMLVRANTAKEAVPFCPYMVHDHYIALWCATKGRIVSLPKRLIRYRIHSANQTPLMAGVVDRQSYSRVRVEGLIQRLVWLKKRFANDRALSQEIELASEWAEARQQNFNGDGKAIWTILRLRRFGPSVSLFEALLGHVPNAVFMLFINLVRKNIL